MDGAREPYVQRLLDRLAEHRPSERFPGECRCGGRCVEVEFLHRELHAAGIAITETRKTAARSP